MTTVPSAAAPAPPSSPSPTSSSSTPDDPPVVTVRSFDGFRALNPANGLFLRAEHLATIQSYARDLAYVAAQGSGTGVVHGFDVTIETDRTSLTIEPGVAITPRGQLLRSRSSITVPLDDRHLAPLGPHGFWRVELWPAAEDSGSAPVYGSLCEDACGDQGRAIEVWRDEGVEVRLTPDSLDGLAGVDPVARRSWLASAYFERERALVPPWLVPAGRNIPVPTLGIHDWDDGTALPAEGGVPVGVLQLVAGRLALDVWTARRLVDGPVAHATWRGRLAMRPWSVFLAQVLQFESQLADSAAGLGSDQKPAELVVLDVLMDNDLTEPLKEFFAHVEGKDVAKWSYVKELADAYERARDVVPAKVVAAKSLIGRGFAELPPAGFLAVDERAPDLLTTLGAYFGPDVDLRRCELRADQVADAVTAAQHTDRIPLVGSTRRPQVDVLVPVVPADKSELVTNRYGWVAFVRRPASCGSEAPNVDAVGIRWAKVPYAAQVPWETYEDGHVHDSTGVGVVRYPADGWAFPGGTAAQEVVDATDPAYQDVHVVALAATKDREPLATLRAALFAAELMDAALTAPVHTYPSSTAEESIIVIVQDRG